MKNRGRRLKVMTLPAVLAAVLAVAGTSAMAFWDTEAGTGGRVTLGSGALSSASDHNVATDGGVTHAVWVSGTTLNYRRSSDGGRTWQSVAGFSPSAVVAGSAPAIGAANGRVIVTYNSGTSIRSVTSNDGGTTWTDAQRATSNTGVGGSGTIDSTFADTVVASNGAATWGFFVYRTSGPGLLGTAGLFVVPFSVSGSTWTFNTAVSVVGSPAAGSSRIAAATGTGNAALMWIPTTGAASFYKSTNSGSSWTSAAPPVTAGVRGLAATGATVHAVYTASGGTYLETYNGSSWGAGTQVIAGSSPVDAAVSSQGSRLLVIAAYSAGSGVQPTSRVSNDGGSTWGQDKTLPTAGGASYTLSSCSGSSDVAVYSDGTSIDSSTWEPDTVAPNTPVVNAAPAGTASIALSWSPVADAAPSSGSIVYSVSTEADVPLGSTASTTYAVHNLTPGTTYGFKVVATDADGNASSASTSVFATTDALRTDLVPNPATPNGVENWYTTVPLIELAFNSVGATYYSWDTTASPSTYLGAIFAPEGEHTLFYRSLDASGHAEEWNSAAFKLDSAAPVPPALAASGSGSSISVTWSGAFDGVSGVAGYEVYDGATLVATTTAEGTVLANQSEGVHSLTVKSVDAAGNVSIPSDTALVVVDVTPPSTTIEPAPPLPDGAGGWYTSQPSISLSSGEPGATYYRWDSAPTEGNQTAYSAPFGAADGEHTLYAYSVDVAGNVGEMVTYIVKVDRTDPAIVVAGVVDSATYTSPQTVTFSATDTNLSALNATLDGEAFISGTTVSANGQHVLVVTANDAAGRTTTRTLTFTIDIPAPDTTAPVTSATIAPASPDGAAGWYVTAPSVTLTSSEPGSTFIKWNGTPVSGDQSLYAAPLVASDGANSIGFYSIDGAGNAETVQTRLLKVDLVAPAAPAVSVGATTESAISLTWGASADTGSGVSAYQVFDATSNNLVATTSGTSTTISGLSPSTTHSYYMKALDVAGNISTASAVVSASTSEAPGVPINAGTGVVVSTPAGVSANFDTVTAAGRFVYLQLSAPAHPAPTNFRLLAGSHWEIQSTATFTGAVTVTVPYQESSVVGPEEAVRLFHWEDGAWNDVTVSVDTAGNTVSGRVTSLSPFSVGSPSASSASTTPASSWWSLLIIGVLGSTAMIRRSGRTAGARVPVKRD